jgi:hydroxyacylglutathione hydrolase
MTDGGLVIRQIEMGPMQNYVYIIGCARTRTAAVVDPAWEVPEILRVAAEMNLCLSHILLTHAHPDHINGLEPLLALGNAKAYLNSREISYMRTMSAQFQIPITFLDRYASQFQLLEDNEVVQMGDIPVKALHTPGHTPGSQCFLVEKSLFSGDTLFVDACGRVDLPGGDPEKMWASLNLRLRSLDDDIVLYPGHNYGDRATATIGEQKRTNPYMQFDSSADFIRAMQ